MAKSKAGGGINSRQTHKVGQKLGAPARAKRHEGVAQYGTARGDHAMQAGGKRLKGDVESTESAKRPISVPLGNEVAASTTCGPGGSRTLYGSAGTQAMHGAPDRGSSPERRDILNDFGPDSAGVRDRK
jgi:hypothetical protein